MRISLPNFGPRSQVNQSQDRAEQHYDLAAHQLATALNIPLDEAQGWVDMAARRARGIRE